MSQLNRQQLKITTFQNNEPDLNLLYKMQTPAPKIPATRCAFHQYNIISHFCRFQQCLLPLCRECLPIHQRQHSSKRSPIDLCAIEQETAIIHGMIGQQLLRLQQVYQQIIGKLTQSNNLHSALRRGVMVEKQKVMQAIDLYYESLCKEVDRNYQRRQMWLQQVTGHYNHAREELLTIKQRLQGEKHLRTIIMWNRLRPELTVEQIAKQTKKQYESPHYVPCDVQQLMKFMSQNQKMTVLDLHGDMGFSQLEKTLYTLRFGEQQNSMISNKHVGISVTSRQSKLGSKLSISKSADKL